MNIYEQKQEKRRERYLTKAASARKESHRRFQTAHSMAQAIPFGQPILVGHHSEKRDRAYRKRIDQNFQKSFDANEKARYYEDKATSVGMGGISSYDPDAIRKLEEKLARLRRRQEFMKAANKAVRMKDEEKGNRQLEELGCDHEKIQSLRMPDCFGHVGFAPFELSNNNANIRRIEERIRRLERQQEREPVHETTELYEFRMEDNRVQFIFDGKPSKEIRDILRRNAFKWSPSRNAWVRQASGNGIYASRIVKEALVRFQKENHAGTSNERRLM